MPKFIVWVSLIFVTSCAQNTQLPIDAGCDVIYGRVYDWDAISDDLARNIYRHNLMCEKMERDGY